MKWRILHNLHSKYCDWREHGEAPRRVLNILSENIASWLLFFFPKSKSSWKKNDFKSQDTLFNKTGLKLVIFWKPILWRASIDNLKDPQDALNLKSQISKLIFIREYMKIFINGHYSFHFHRIWWFIKQYLRRNGMRNVFSAFGHHRYFPVSNPKWQCLE